MKILAQYITRKSRGGIAVREEEHGRRGGQVHGESLAKLELAVGPAVGQQQRLAPLDGVYVFGPVGKPDQRQGAARPEDQGVVLVDAQLARARRDAEALPLDFKTSSRTRAGRCASSQRRLQEVEIHEAPHHQLDRKSHQ